MISDSDKETGDGMMNEHIYASYLDKKLDLSQLYSAIENNIKNYLGKKLGLYTGIHVTINEKPIIDDISIKMDQRFEKQFLEIINDFEEEFGLKRVRVTRFERIFTDGRIQEVSERNVTYSFKAK